MSPDLLVSLVSYLVVLILSLTVHEWGHAASAYLLGDDTAAREGRLTLSPLPHIDPVGTLMIPAFQVISAATIGHVAPLFGYARPVPVNGARFNRNISMRAGEALTGMAGPAMNIVLAVLSALVFGCLVALQPEWLVDITDPERAPRPLWHLLRMLMTLNIGLAFFNLIPIPPLDGGWVLQWVLPQRLQWVLESLARHGMWVLIIAIFLPGYIGVSGAALTVVALLVSVGAWLAQKTLPGPARSSGAELAETVLQWAAPLTVALATTQLSWFLIGTGLRYLDWQTTFVASTLAGLR